MARFRVSAHFTCYDVKLSDRAVTEVDADVAPSDDDGLELLWPVAEGLVKQYGGDPASQIDWVSEVTVEELA